MSTLSVPGSRTAADSRLIERVGSPLRQVLSGTLRVFLAEALILPTGLATTAILTRDLGPSTYGLFVIAITTITWIEWSIAALFSRAAYKVVAEASDWRPVATTLLQVRLMMSVAAGLGLVALSEPIAVLFGEPELKGYLMLFALDIPLFGMAQAHSNVLVGIGAFNQRAWLSAGRWIGRLCLVALFAKLGFSIEGAIWASIGASIIELAIARRFVQLPILARSAFPARRLWHEALPLALFAVGMRLFDKMDLFFLKALGATATQAGFYGGAQNLALVPGLLTMSMSPLVLSTIARLLRDGEERHAKEVAGHALRWIVALVPFAALAAGAADEIVSLVLGHAFVSAAEPFRPLVVGASALGVLAIATAILAARGRAAWTFYLTGPMVPLAVAGHLLAIPRFGPSGAACVTLAVAAIGAAATVIAVERLQYAHLPPRTLLINAAVALAAYVVASGVPAPGALVIVKLATLSVAIAGSLWMLGELEIKRPQI